jgi:hypothetical protein
MTIGNALGLPIIRGQEQVSRYARFHPLPFLWRDGIGAGRFTRAKFALFEKAKEPTLRQTEVVMPYVLRKDYPGGSYPTYIAVGAGYENHIGRLSVKYDPDLENATRFQTRQEAERVQAMLSGGQGTITVIEV